MKFSIVQYQKSLDKTEIMPLSWEKYLHCVDHFLAVSSTTNDDWILVEKSHMKSPENCYLFKKVVENCAGIQSEEREQLLEESMEPDLSSVRDSLKANSETLVWEYHILYSPSYSVPLLYFNVRNSAGKLLSLETVWNILNVPKEMLQEKWSFISQQEHPILLRPFFHLHPCKSIELLKVGEDSTVNPLVTWLSSVAHIVHLSVPLDYGNKPFLG